MTPEIDQRKLSRALVAALRSSPSFGSDGAVRRGRFAKPPAGTLPFAGLSPPGIESTQGEEIGSYDRTITYDLQVWGTTQSADEDDQVEEAEVLLDEVLRALEESRINPKSELARVGTFDVSSTVIWGGFEGMPSNMVGAFLVLKVSYPRRLGLQGAS